MRLHVEGAPIFKDKPMRLYVHEKRCLDCIKFGLLHEIFNLRVKFEVTLFLMESCSVTGQTIDSWGQHCNLIVDCTVMSSVLFTFIIIMVCLVLAR